MKPKNLWVLLFVGFLATMFCSTAYAAGPEKKEVEQRIELNNATVDQIVSFGVVTKEEAKKIVNLREALGSFQGYDDLLEVIPAEKVEKLKPFTTIQGIASDCTC